MPANLFEYAVLRIVPRVEREEFLNVGIILFCPAERFLQAKFELPKERLLAFRADLDLDALHTRLCAFDQICQGGPAGGPIGQLPLAGRFRWLTANRSTMVQTSAVHPGLCTGAAETMAKLYVELVQLM